MPSDIPNRVRAIIAKQLNIDPAEVDGLDFTAFNSLDSVELVMKLEDELELSIPDEHVERIHSFAVAIEYLLKRTDDEGPASAPAKLPKPPEPPSRGHAIS